MGNQKAFHAAVEMELENFNRVNALLDIDDLDEADECERAELGAEPHSSETLFSVKFEDGTAMTMRLASGGTNYYTDVEFCDAAGHLRDVDEAGFVLSNHESIVFNDAEYVVDINLICRAEVYMTSAKLNQVKTLLELSIINNLRAKEKKTLNARPNTSEILFYARFEDDAHMTLSLESGATSYYIEAALRDVAGRVLKIFRKPSLETGRQEVFVMGNKKYIINIKIADDGATLA